MDKFYVIKNKKGLYYAEGAWNNIVDVARKYNTREDAEERLNSIITAPLSNCEVVEIPTIADLEAKLAESEKLNKRLQQVIDKLRDKEFAGETLVNAVNAVYEPLYQNKYDEAEQLKQQLAEWQDGTIICKWTDAENKVKELEQQLAEKDQAIENWKTMYKSVMQTCNNDAKEIERLREKLANTTVFAPKISNNAELILQIIESDRVGIDFLKQSQNQTAIAELEKIKEYMEKKLVEFDNTEMRIIMGLYAFNIENQIDQQIKSLKGDK